MFAIHYYTLEWYLKRRCAGLFLNLAECGEKESACPEYYEKLLAVFAEEIRFDCERISQMSFEEYKREVCRNSSYEDFVRYKNEHNPDSAQFYAARHISERIKTLKLILPGEIYSKIPDIRIFALNRADSRCIDMISEYSRQCEDFVRETDFRFEEEYTARTEPIPNDIWEEYGFEGGKILRIAKHGTDYTFYLDNYDNCSDVFAMHLDDTSVERLDDCLEGAVWIYNELYLVNGEYEVCGLCQNGDKFPQFTIYARDIYFDFDR